MYFWDKHKTITTYYELLSGEVCDRYGLTQMEYDILMFLHNNPQYNTAAEIVKIEYSNAIVHAFQRFRAPFSGKIVHIFPEQSAVI